jgi:hypothetical protein
LFDIGKAAVASGFSRSSCGPIEKSLGSQKATAAMAGGIAHDKIKQKVFDSERAARSEIFQNSF